MVSLRLFRLFHRAGIGHDSHDFFPLGFRVLEQLQRVVVALRHFFAIEPGHFSRVLQHFGFGHHERLAKVMVEAGGKVAAHFDVLHLIGSDGHDVGIVRQNVGRHQYRIRK